MRYNLTAITIHHDFLQNWVVIVTTIITSDTSLKFYFSYQIVTVIFKYSLLLFVREIAY